MACSGDPLGQGFIASLARPGGNTTGLSCQSVELLGKQLQLLKELVPDTPRIAVLGNPAISTYAAQVREVQAAAHALGVELHILEVRSPTEFTGAFATMRREGAGALVVLPDGGLLLDRYPRDIAAFALQSRLTAMYPWRWYVDAGGLMSYAPRMPDLQRRAATYVDKILKGATPADLPVEQPTTFHLVLNLKTAQALGLTIPLSLLFQADEIIR